MPSSLQDAVKVPVTLALADGNEYTFEKIGLDIWCEFCDHINRGLDRKPGHCVTLEEMLEHAQTLPGMRWLLWRSLRKHHRNVKLETIGELVGDITMLGTIFTAIADMPEVDESADPQNGEL